MVKTTVYLPDDVKASLERVAREEQRSEAEIIRQALQTRLALVSRPRPRIPLTDRALGDRRAAEHVNVLLEGFGTT